MKRSSLIVLALLLAMPVSAQEEAPRVRSMGVAVVNSNNPAAHVYADSTWLGPASREVFELPAGVAEIRVVPSELGAWGLTAFRQPAMGLDTVRVDAQFPYAYRLEATPFAAQVTLVNGDERQPLGSTPLQLSVPKPLAGTLVFERDGHAAVEILAGDRFWNRHLAVMQPVADVVETPSDIRLDMQRRSWRWVDYAAVGAALTGGALAVHYKLKADKRFDAYQETGNPDLRPRIEQLDRQSAWALGAMQTGVGVFALRLVFR
ncbi:MAG: hypothetical protein JJ896_17440 [Rhodothermales bacterium]|nr:hypothetical protein [Rhodothermales bacterium]MBO6781446.1 hypothetical protein [Rhodothermales bacterium]